MFAPVAAMQLLLAAASVAAPGAPPAGSYLAQLQETARARRLAETRDWEVLLHYRRSRSGGVRSEADGLGFFVAGRTGQHDPAAELDADLAGFLAPEPANDEHAQCRFPARWQWLKSVLAIDPTRVPERRCPIFDTWRTGISAEAATLVFAAAYLNSPGSMYGHTFLRISRSTGEGNPLLDYILNFAADVTTNNGLVYAVKGLTGFFPGRFSVMPYYIKVQEYSNVESRDLWEYELALTREQVQRMVAHAWETRTTYFDYYFFTRNCSYQLLTLLEVADPTLHLVEAFGGAVIPANTVRVVVQQPGLVRRTEARPSLLSVMKQRKDVLSTTEIRAAEAWVAASPGGPAPAARPGVAPERQALVIDAAYDYLRYREGLRAEPSDNFKQQERRMLIARGRLGVPPQEVVTRPSVDAPERGHATYRVGLGAGFSDQGGPFQTLSFRGAIHDYLDSDRGYPPDARLQMGAGRLRFDDRRRALSLDHLDVLDIVSGSPLDRWVRGVSWKLWLGADNARELGCARPESDHAGWRCLYGGLITGGGLATRFGPRRSLLLLLLAETDLGAGPAFADPGGGYRVGAGGEITLVGAGWERWRFEIGARYAYYFLGARPANLRARAAEAIMITRRLALRVEADTAGTYAQAALDLLAYF